MKTPYPGVPPRPRSTFQSVDHHVTTPYDTPVMNALNSESPALRHRRSLLTRLKQHAYLRGRIDGKGSYHRDDLYWRLQQRKLQLENEIREAENALYWADPAYGDYFPNSFQLPYGPSELYSFLRQDMTDREGSLIGEHARTQEEYIIKNGVHPRNYYYPLEILNANFDPNELRDDHGRWTEGGGTHSADLSSPYSDNSPTIRETKDTPLDASTSPLRLASTEPPPVDYQYPDGTIKRRSGGSHAWRNNNPGNIKGNPPSPGQIGVDPQGFAIFPDKETGRKALNHLLHKPFYQNRTVNEVIKKYAPPKENNTAKYQAFVAKLTGLNPNTKLSDLTEEQLNKLQAAIERYEGWREGKEEVIKKRNTA